MAKQEPQSPEIPTAQVLLIIFSFVLFVVLFAIIAVYFEEWSTAFLGLVAVILGPYLFREIKEICSDRKFIDSYIARRREQEDRPKIGWFFRFLHKVEPFIHACQLILFIYVIYYIVKNAI